MLTIGFDDTDSDKGLCTTYLAAVMVERLAPLGRLIGPPRLVRLNPCTRFKTRGNAAVALTLDSHREEEVKEMAFRTLLELSDLSGLNTHPGLVVTRERTQEMTRFYRRAVTEILEIREAREILQSEGIWYRGVKLGRGLIGALAAAGARFPDHTYELIAYRARDRWGTPRQIDHSSVWDADRSTYPLTWDTVDLENQRVVFTPHSPDPVLLGIRGEDPASINRTFHLIRSERPERTLLYITNQGTDAHILPEGELLLDDRSYRLRGKVLGSPWDIRGGHMFFSLKTHAGAVLCAAFEPTKGFRGVVRRLRQGDELYVYGAMREGTLNLEKMEVMSLARETVLEAPFCPICHRRMKSAGREQGFRCRRCRTRTLEPVSREVPRDLERGFYEVPPSARRHLSKPLVRMRAVSSWLHLSR